MRSTRGGGCPPSLSGWGSLGGSPPTGGRSPPHAVLVSRLVLALFRRGCWLFGRRYLCSRCARACASRARGVLVELRSSDRCRLPCRFGWAAFPRRSRASVARFLAACGLSYSVQGDSPRRFGLCPSCFRRLAFGFLPSPRARLHHWSETMIFR